MKVLPPDNIRPYDQSQNMMFPPNVQDFIKDHDLCRVIDDVVELLAVELVGLIPEDEEVITSTNRGIPVALNGKSKAGQAFRNIAQRLNGEAVPFMDMEDEGIFGRFTRFIRQGGN